MGNKVVDNYPHALEFVPNYFKTQKTCNKTVDTYPFEVQYVLDWYKIHKMCVKAVDAFPIVFDSVSVSDWYKT